MALADRANKKRWLGRYRKLVDEINSLEFLERERFATVTGTSANVLDGMPRPPQTCNRSDNVIIKHLEIQTDLIELRQRADETRREICGAINCLEDPNQAQVLRFKYINGFGWPEMQERLHYSRGGLYSLHSKGLDSLIIPCQNVE